MSKAIPSLTLSVIAVVALAGQEAGAQGYVFTKVADSAVDDLDPFSTGAPSLSDEGHVAFAARRADKSGTRVLRSGPGLAGPLTTIIDSADPKIGTVFTNVSVNDAGQVAVWATISGPKIDERIVLGDGGKLLTIAEAGDDRAFSFMSVIVSVNDSGTVAWQGELNEPGGPQGLFTGDGGLVNIIFSTASSNFTSSFAGPAINDSGQIAFRASTTSSGGDAIFRYDGDSMFTTIADSSGPFSAAFDDEPDINNAGQVALIARSDDLFTEYVVVGDGAEPATPVADTTGELESFGAVGINNAGQVAFSGLFEDFTTQGIFTGPDLVKDRVIGTGDQLDGSTVTLLSMYREALNDAGQIAFFAQLADGRAVVMVASPAPGPCSADFNDDGTVNSQDFFDFLTPFFASDPAADFNADGIVNSQDFFDFLTAFFTGC